MNRKTACIFPALALLISACTVGPNFTPSTTKTAKEWTGEINHPSALDNTHQQCHQEWWQQFNDPVLDSLVEYAYKNNPTLQIIGVRIFQARAQLHISEGKLFPQTQAATGSLTYRRRSNNSSNSNLIDQNLGVSNLGFQVEWELDFWGKYRRAIEASNAAYLSSTSAYDNALVTLIADVSSVYVNIRILEERLQVAQNNIVLQTESHRIAKVRYEAGETSKLDLEQASTQLSQTESTIPELKLSLKKQKNTLALLLGETPDKVDGLLAHPAAIPHPPAAIFTGVPVDMLRQRPDVKQAEYDAMTQSANIGVAKSALYPSFSLNGFFGSSANNNGNASLKDMFNWNNTVLSTGGSFLFPVFNYGRIINQVRVQDAVFQQAVLNYQNTVLSAQKEVEDALASYHYSREQADWLQKATISSKEAARLSLVQYKAGQTDFTRVLSADQAELQNEDSYVNAKGNIVLAAIATYRALGSGWDIHNKLDVLPEDVRKTMEKRTYWGKMLRPIPSKIDTIALKDKAK